MRLRLLLLTILALLLGACSAPEQEPGQPTGNANETNTPQPASTDTPAATTEPTLTETTQAPVFCEDLPEVTTEGEDGVTVPENALIVFQKTGGFAGISETTVIYADGSVENDKNEAFQITPEEAEALVAEAEKGGFFDFSRSYVPENHCCDFFNYSLTIRSCDQVATVITADEVPQSPAELEQLVDEIDLLASKTTAALHLVGSVDPAS